MKESMFPKGHVVISFFDKEGKLLRQQALHNQITQAGLDIAFNRGLGTMFKCGGDLFGQVQTVDSFCGQYQGNPLHYNNTAIHVGLLNLGDKQSGLTPQSSFANFYDAAFASLDKVIGFAGIDTTSATSGKEGAFDFSRGSLVPASCTRGLRWVFPVNVAGGSFDTLVLTGRSTLNNPYPMPEGEISSICLDKINMFSGSTVSMSTGYCPPGVTGVTAANEILLNFNDGNSSRWRFNMDTGEISEVADTDPFFVPVDATIDDWFMDGDYLYTVVGGASSSSAVTRKVNVYKISTQTLVSSFNVSVPSSTYMEHLKFLSYNGSVYLTVNSTNDASTATVRCWTLSKGSKEYYSAATAGTSISATIGITLPSGLPLNKVCLGNFGNDYIIYIGDVGVVCSSLEDVQGTMKEVIPFVLPFMCAYSKANGADPGFLSVGAPGNAQIGTYADGVNRTGSNWLVGGTAGANTIALKNKSICWIPNGHWGNMTSYYKLPKTETKSDDVIMTVDWYYDFSGGTSESGQTT